MRGDWQRKPHLLRRARQRETRGKDAPVSLPRAARHPRPQERSVACVVVAARVLPPVSRFFVFPELVGRLDHLVEAVYDRFKDRYFEGERKLHFGL